MGWRTSSRWIFFCSAQRRCGILAKPGRTRLKRARRSNCSKRRIAGLLPRRLRRTALPQVTQLDVLAKNAVVIYPILLPDRTEPLVAYRLG